MRSMTALVTGATGFLGVRLVSRLLSDRQAVRVLARSEQKARPLADAGAELIVGDITDEAAVARAVNGVEVVYHLAGRLLEPGVPADVYRRTHVGGTQLLLDRCRRSPAVHRFVHVSTTGVLGATGVRPADESAPLRPTNVYEATKAEAELAVRRASRDWLPAVIARPGLVYGPGDAHLLGFFRAVLRRQFRPIGRRTVWLHPIYIDDMVEGLVRCGQRDAAVGECFHLAGRDPVQLAQLATAIAMAGGTSVPAGCIPLPAARAVAAACDRLPPSLKRSAPLTRSRLEFLTHSRVYDVTKARRVLGFDARTDLATGTKLSMAWYRAQGLLPAGT
jgi:nucleoside-diphosphate-sugar epimerase